MNNRRVTPKELTQTHAARPEEVLDKALEAHAELRCLVQQKGWLYVRDIANSILAEYECPPPKEDKDREKWNSYTHMKWALDKLISKVEKYASQKPTIEKVNNANQRRK